MAGADNIVINNLERALSTDINDLQSIQARFLSEFLQYMVSERNVAAGAVNGTTIRDVVLGGLNVIPSGAAVDVLPGAMAQLAASLPPVPGALDSNYRLAHNLVATNVPAPSPGSDTYYLLEAQMTSTVITTETRDVFDPATSSFNPTLVTKQIDRQIQFQFTAGTATQAPPNTANWVPIAVVFRAGGGGPVGINDVSDTRPLWQARVADHSVSPPGALVLSRGLESNSFSTNDTLFRFDFEARVLGQQLFARTGSGTSVDLASPLFQDPSNPAFPDSSDIWYIYLAAPRDDQVPSNLYQSTVSHRGMVIVSRVQPNRNQVNTALLECPAPFLGVSVAVGGAACVGAIRRQQGIPSIPPQWCTRNGVHRFMRPYVVGTVSNGTPEADVDLDVVGTNSTEVVPANASTMSIEVQNALLDLAASVNVVITPFGALTPVFYDIPGPAQTGGAERTPPYDLSLVNARAYRFTLLGTLGSSAFSINEIGWTY